MNAKYSVIALACAASLVTSSVFAQLSSTNNGRLVGQINLANDIRSVAGAQVEIVELGVTTSTQRDGSFRFSGIPEGNYTLKVSYLGASASTHIVNVEAGQVSSPTLTIVSDGLDEEEIVIYAQRSATASALSQKRYAETIKSIVSADAIGQFPDQNVAESLQRLPGLSIARDQGEGRFVEIRGIDPNLNNVTINGLNVPSPEAGVRSVALDVIPSELVQTLEVSKSVTADQDADAIGGSVEIKSVSAFDRQEDIATLTGQLSYNDLRSETSPKLAGSFTHKFNDSIGIAAALSYFKRDFGSDNVESNGEDEVEQRFYDITRERIGGAINLDFRPDVNNSYYVRTLFSQFSDDEQRLANTFTLDGEDSEIERASREREETQSIFTLSAGGEHLLNNWTVEYQIGYAKSDEDEPDNLVYEFVTENDSIDFDINTQIPQVSQNTDALNLNNYELNEIAFEDNLAEDTEFSAKFDLTRTLSLGTADGEFQFGAKYRDREKTQTANVFIYGGDFDDINPDNFASAQPDWGLGQFGPGLNRSTLRSFFNDNRSGFELDDLNSDLESGGASFNVNEDIFAAYALTRIDYGKLHIVAGVRYERTEFSTDGSRVELIENEQTDVEEVVSTNFSASRDYDFLLPSINARYEMTEKVVLRAAFSQTLSRPTFEQSGAFQIIESTTEEDDGEFVTERSAEVGNPALEPFEASNVDLAIEFYPGGVGVLSVGLFYKDIDNFIINADVAGIGEFENFEEVIQPINGENAELIGLELAWVKNFDNGLLFSANATFTSSDAVTELNGERFETSLPNQSDRIGNVVVGYENQTLSLRLSATYKSENLEEIDGEFLRLEDDHTQIDFTAKYFVTPQINVYFNAINITDEPFYAFFDERQNNAQFEEYGSTYELGFRWQF